VCDFLARGINRSNEPFGSVLSRSKPFLTTLVDFSQFSVFVADIG
jgi:hypothetical protein